MIIDDEKALRNLLKVAIDWETLGLKVAGEAQSGIEAINTIDEIRPDIVFVDIRMPFMDGIEFSKLAINRYPKLKIIVLTAYSDFEYARKCIGIGVCEYLLKPIVRTEIVDILKNITAKLQKEKPEEVIKNIPDNNNLTIKRIKEYIRTNYANPDLNVTAIAQTFGFNASYLSRMYKSETGQNVIDCLTSCRMEKAKICAKSGELMYQAAKTVGIPDPNYFGKCFKKYTSIAYSEYMKQGRQEE